MSVHTPGRGEQRIFFFLRLGWGIFWLLCLLCAKCVIKRYLLSVYIVVAFSGLHCLAHHIPVALYVCINAAGAGRHRHDVPSGLPTSPYCCDGDGCCADVPFATSPLGTSQVVFCVGPVPLMKCGILLHAPSGSTTSAIVEDVATVSRHRGRPACAVDGCCVQCCWDAELCCRLRPRRLYALSLVVACGHH